MSVSVMALTAPNTLRTPLRKPLNVLVTGAAGSGKTSTIDALFKARDGQICLKTFSASSGMTRYDFGGLVVWECPGLGGDEANEAHNVHVLRQLLGEHDKDGCPLIDLVLLLVDASRRDLGTTFDLLNQVLIPSFEACEHRLVVALNQADMAMKGRHWDFDACMPLPPLREFLDEKAASLARRLHENTGLHCAPIYYSAGFGGEGERQSPYNLQQLLWTLVQQTPPEHRTLYKAALSDVAENWKSGELHEQAIQSLNQALSESLPAAQTYAEVSQQDEESTPNSGEGETPMQEAGWFAGLRAFFAGWFAKPAPVRRVR